MAFQQGLSGLNSSSKALDVISNNVANASTVGFKNSGTVFADAYASSLTGAVSKVQIGIGSAVQAVRRLSPRATSPPPAIRWTWRSTAMASLKLNCRVGVMR